MRAGFLPVILSGGSGSRLWPVSRDNYPKQFCQFYDESFLHNSIHRLKKFGQPWIVTLDSMRGLTERALMECEINEGRIIGEPFAKNTAAAVALVCHELLLEGHGDLVVGIFPADHLITDPRAFENSVELAALCAEEGEVVTLGLTPRYPSTGYGYIEIHQDVFKESSDQRAHHVVRFHEKPVQKVAEEYAQSGRHYWNSGMFIFKVKVMVEHLKQFMPSTWGHISGIKKDHSNLRICYANIDSVSIDVGVMEKLGRLICIPAEMGWSDVGSWDEIARLAEEFPQLKTEQKARVFGEASVANYVFSQREKVVGLVGVSGLIVVDTADGLLITRKGESQGVKGLVEQIRRAGLPAAADHLFEKRPWGRFEVLSETEKFKIKSLLIEPGKQLSLQSHRSREEHWVVVEGVATVTLDDTVKDFAQSSYVHIPQGSKHRLSNKGPGPLLLVEVQMGEYLGEDDITRYQDDYKRV